MADTKISALPASTTPLAGTEVLPIVQGGATKQVSVADLTAGRAISATQLTLTTENLVIGTSGKGIDFSATSGTGTSELLADYEEGTFTPVVEGSTTPGTATYSTQSGVYTKIGRMVQFTVNVGWSGHTGTGGLRISGLPFATSGIHTIAIRTVDITMPATSVIQGYVNSTQCVFETQPVGGGGAPSLAMDAAGSLLVSGCYIV
jgi:hypothetical protein